MQLLDYILISLAILLFLSFYLNIALSYKIRTLYRSIKDMNDKLYLTDKELIKLNKEYELEAII